MSEISCTDWVSDAVTTVIGAVKEGFDPDSECPPVGGGSATVRFFTWEGAPLAAWDAHNSGGEGCDEPFLWVRLVSRSRTVAFPQEEISSGPCKGQKMAPLEIGVGRCSALEGEVDWKQLAAEAEISLDDSWRLEQIMCRASRLLAEAGHAAGIDTIVPYGPEGGVTAWMGVLYVGN